MVDAPLSSSFRIDAQSDSLLCGAKPTALGRRAVALLRLLLDRAGEPVPREALIEAAWPGLAVEEGNLSVQIAALRRVLGEEADGASWIETLPRRGYRYVGPPIPVVNGPIVKGHMPPSQAASPATATLPLPEKPSVAVLPFSSAGVGPEHEHFVDGMVEDIIAALSRFKSLFVIARNSSFAYKDRTVDTKVVGRELGVRYVVEGRIRKTGRSLQVAVQLIDAESAYHLWSERYVRELEDFFAVQEEIARAIVSALPGRVEDAGRDVAIRKQTSSITAYDLVLLGNQQWRRLNRRDLAEARERFRAAIALDPNDARAHANVAWTIVCETFLETQTAATLDDALRHIETALNIDGDDAWSHAVLAQVFFLRNEDSRAETSFNRALALNPNDADVAAVFANIQVYWGRWREALEWIGTAKRLNPFSPNLYHWYHALALYSGRQYRDAIETLKKAHPLHGWSYGLIAACYAQIGMRDEARAELNRFVEERHRELRESGEPIPADPLDLARIRAERYRNPRDRKHFLDGLRKAGLGDE
ncbi:MAG: winged helix-turn-helix domain-containing protein [Alphaproteobacteria bacterium]|nr:winged helix-turn-helix domain-containing protein [Alphaproteobacteria bacterium]